MGWQSLVAATLLAAMSMVAQAAHANDAGFDAWRADFSRRAVAQGIPAEVVQQNLAPLTLDAYVIELDGRQPEKRLSFSDYITRVVNPKRIAKGRELLQQHGSLLAQVSEAYQVEPQYIVALWGVETDYGRNTGDFLVLQSLASLAYEGRRRELFEGELMAALQMLSTGQWHAHQLVGSWAGAMGNCQFMPSSYLKFAVDFDGNGVADIWNSLPDTFASIAHYLHRSGWQEGLGWGEPGEGAGAIYPGEAHEGGYRVTDNYDVIMKWNRSRYFATSVGLLADALVR